MADEDALFAEFMGEIKSTVVAAVAAAEPKADQAGLGQVGKAGEGGEADGDGDGAASDTASVGDVNADTDNDNADGDTNKRKGEVRADDADALVCASAGLEKFSSLQLCGLPGYAETRLLPLMQCRCAIHQAGGQAKR